MIFASKNHMETGRTASILENQCKSVRKKRYYSHSIPNDYCANCIVTILTVCICFGHQTQLNGGLKE